MNGPVVKELERLDMNEDQNKEAARDMELGLAQMEQLKAQIESLRLQGQSLQAVILDHQSSIEVLTHLGEGGEDEVMLPVGGSVLLRAKLLDKQNCLLDHGAGVIAEVGKDAAVEKLKERTDSLRSSLTTLDKALQELVGRYERIAARTQELYSQQMGGEEGPEGTF